MAKRQPHQGRSLNPDGTFLRMESVEKTFGRKGVTVDEHIHKKRNGFI